MTYRIKFLETDGSPLGARVAIELLGDGESIGFAEVTGLWPQFEAGSLSN
jgi:hypothetical protein